VRLTEFQPRTFPDSIRIDLPPIPCGIGSTARKVLKNKEIH
jgi:hypothetical protein